MVTVALAYQVLTRGRQDAAESPLQFLAECFHSPLIHEESQPRLVAGLPGSEVTEHEVNKAANGGGNPRGYENIWGEAARNPPAPCLPPMATLNPLISDPSSILMAAVSAMS